VEECTYFWGVNTSWGINMAENKIPLHQEDNQAPQPTEDITVEEHLSSFYNYVDNINIKNEDV
jgi:hypothetical protein